ncbi:MAG: phosphatase PAP2 family protein [Bacteroidetes bacterium]|nr:phosphatase PAP2 family protein [Bacteroidota bacterium]
MKPTFSRLLAIMLLLCCISTAISQNPYKTTWKRELAWVGGSGIGIGTAALLHVHNQPFTAEKVAALDLGRVPRFERFVTRQYSISAQHNSDILLFTSVASPVLLLLDKNIRHDAPTAALLLGESMWLNLALTSLCKEIVRRPRPFCYNSNAPLFEKLKRDARASFFSGHTSMSAAATFSAAQIWSDYHPDSEWKPLVWATAVAIPATVGFLRVKGGKHFISDVATGFIVGGACGLLIPRLHRK